MSSPLLPVYARTPLRFTRGAGPYLFTEDGTRYLDFASGIGVTALGHAHPHLAEALARAIEKPWHLSNLYEIPEQEALAKRLVDAVGFAEKVFFTNSGAEAVECAIKIARAYHAHTGNAARNTLITFEGAFHGRTLATISAAGQSRHLDGFAPALPGFHKIPFGDMDALERAVTSETAGFLIEPVQGEGGIRPASAVFLRKLRALADKHGLLLVLDEVQCGMGRTGRLFAYEAAGIEPDILATAKGLGGGFPIGACLASARAAEGMSAGRHGSTFGGNPLAMAAAGAVLDVMFAPGFFEHVRAMELRLSQKLAMLANLYPEIIADWRGVGLMFGIVCHKDKRDALVKACRAEGLLLVGAAGEVVRLLPPLTLEETHFYEAMDKIDAACAGLTKDAA